MAGQRKAGQRKRAPQGRVVAVTGAAGNLGRLLVHTLAAEGRYARVVALSHLANPPNVVEHPTPVTHHRVDLTEPTSDARLSDVLAREHVDTVVHGAFLSSPSPDHEFAHELEVIGTLHVLTACVSARVSRVVMLGSTMCYGALPQNPARIREESQLQGSRGFPYVSDKVEAEAELVRFCATHKGLSATVLRLCPLLGHSLNNLWSNYLRKPVAPTVMGHDPLVQVLHPVDALRAVRLAVAEDTAGTFNVVGRGVVPLSTMVKMAGGVALPIMRPLAGPTLSGLRAAGVVAVPPQLTDYLTYTWVADGEKAAHELGYVPQFGARETVMHLMGVGPALHVGMPSHPGETHVH